MPDTIISAAVSVFLILLIRKGLARHVSAKAVYALWLIPVIQLLVFCQPSVKGLFHSFFGEHSTLLSLAYPEVYDNLADNLNQIVISGESFRLEQAVNEGNGEAKIRAGIPMWRILRFLWVTGCCVTSIILLFPHWRMWLYAKEHRKLYPEKVYGQKVYLLEHLPSSCLLGGNIYVSCEQQQREGWFTYIVLHEAMHRKQGDVFWNMVRVICVIVYWWHPAVWIAAYVSKTDSEYACDEKATQGMTDEEKRIYGKILLELATNEVCELKNEFLSYEVRGGKMKERIGRIIRKEEDKSSLKKAVFFFSTLALFFIVLLSVTDKGVLLENQGQYKKILEYATAPVSRAFCIESAVYEGGTLSVIIGGDTDEICEVKEKWLECKKDGVFYVVPKSNLQKDKMIHYLTGEKHWKDVQKKGEKGNRCMSYVRANSDGLITDFLREDFKKNYPALTEGEYLMNYVLYYSDSDRYELLQTSFQVGEK